MKKIKDLVNLVSMTANYEIPINQQKRTLNRIRKLTEEVWSNHHNILLNELEKIEDLLEPKADYQLYWFECLEFPRITPRLFQLNGRPYALGYNDLPSDFNTIKYGLNDSNITQLLRKDTDLKLFINNLEESIFNEIVITFHNVSSIFYNNIESKNPEINNFTILSIGEAPPIDYCLKHLELPTQKKNANKRLFYFHGQQIQHKSIYIFAEKWSIETF